MSTNYSKVPQNKYGLAHYLINSDAYPMETLELSEPTQLILLKWRMYQRTKKSQMQI